MSGIRSLYMGVAQKGYASAASVPIRVDPTSKTIRYNPNQTGTTESELLSSVPTPVVVNAATLTLSAALHAWRAIILTSLTGCAVTLPAATGSGQRYRLYIGVAPTSGSVTVAVASAADFMRGFGYVKTDDTTVSSNTYATANSGTLATESDTITWNRTTSGAAIIGDYMEIEDIAVGIWAVATENTATGTEVTPFSAAV